MEFLKKKFYFKIEKRITQIIAIISNNVKFRDIEYSKENDIIFKCRDVLANA